MGRLGHLFKVVFGSRRDKRRESPQAVGARRLSQGALNLFGADTPLHDGALLVRGNRILSAGVILPLSRQGITRYGTRHLAALGITERFDRCLCIVVSEETGTLSLARQGKLERPITSSRLRELLTAALALSSSKSQAKASGGSVVPLPTGRTVAEDTPESRA